MSDPTPSDATHWHARSVDDVAADLDTSAAGLSTDEVRARRERFGPNVLPHEPPPSLGLILWRQFQSPLIFILALAAGVSIATGHAEDALFIGVVLILNASIGGYQEWRAERSSRALQKLLHVRASVERDGELHAVDAEDLVPGDVVRLESGARVPADMRLFVAHGLEVDESLLTGESLAVTKDAARRCEPSAPLAERRTMAFAGSSVTRGRGRGLVVATGLRTEVGQLAVDVLGAGGGRPPLLLRMERFARVVAYTVLAASALIGVLGVVLRGYTAADMFLFGVALAVSAIPEGLPVALTVALSVATSRMARRGAIVRRLAAVEGLGSCTLIASDKTGTLTCNELTVRVVALPDGREFAVEGEGYAPVGSVHLVAGRGGDGRVLDASTRDDAGDDGARADLDALARAAVLCNEGSLHRRAGAWTWSGDPTDVALLSLGHKLGLAREDAAARRPQVGAIPFEPERQFAATFHRDDDGVRVFVKGAPERVLAMTRGSASERAARLDAAESMARRGFRVLAFATGRSDAPFVPGTEPPAPADLGFLGFTGMIDPLRPGAKDAVRSCRDAGIDVSMITGDHPDTALAIARDLGFADGAEQVVSGRELETLSDAELRDVVLRARVFARATPRQKLQLVKAAREGGHFVAVTGDGVNDAPALREANIGVAMGRSGTDVAREAAEVVLTDDNFATIVAGIEEGRIAYDNVRKVVSMQVSTGAAEVLLLGLAVATGFPERADGWAVLPLLPVQILWLNLVTNGIQDVALAFEPGEGDVLARPPRPPGQRLIDGLMIERTLVAAAIMAGVSFGAFCWMIEVAGWTEDESRNALLLLMVLFQNVHMGNCRSETRSIVGLSPLRSPILLGGTAAALGVHLTAMHMPVTQRLLGLQPVDLPTFAALAALSLSIVIAVELHKAWRRGRSVAREIAGLRR